MKSFGAGMFDPTFLLCQDNQERTGCRLGNEICEPKLSGPTRGDEDDSCLVLMNFP